MSRAVYNSAIIQALQVSTAQLQPLSSHMGVPGRCAVSARADCALRSHAARVCIAYITVKSLTEQQADVA